MATQEEINQAALMGEQMDMPMGMPAVTPKEELLANIQQQKMDIYGTKKIVDQLAKAKTQIDLTPIAALVDNWTGSNFSSTYKPGFTEQEKNKLMMAYNKIMGDQTKQLTATEMALLKGEKQAGTMVAKDIKKEQSDAIIYGNRAKEADSIIENIVGQGEYDPTSAKAMYTSSFLMPEVTKGTAQKKLEQAQRNFANAVLRKESGATISPSEFKNAQLQYFPTVGDSSEIIEQKRQNRAQFIEGMKVVAGSHWKELATPQRQQTPNFDEMPDEQLAAYLGQ